MYMYCLLLGTAYSIKDAQTWKGAPNPCYILLRKTHIFKIIAMPFQIGWSLPHPALACHVCS